MQQVRPATLMDLSQLPAEVQARLRRRLDEVVEQDRQAEKSGRAESVEFTADSPAQAAARQLRQAASERGISQKELAARLGVTPAVINRVFKNPDRSKVSTIRKIAAALGVHPHEII